MTRDQFDIFWQSTYDDTILMSHYFKYDYKDRWFRIHSLPESNRYPENEQDWDILLSRQNKIISDLIGNSEKLLIVTGEYNNDGGFNSSDSMDNEL